MFSGKRHSLRQRLPSYHIFHITFSELKICIASGCIWGLSKNGIASGAFFLPVPFFVLKICIASGCTWGFPQIYIASGASFLHITYFEFEFCIASSGTFVYSNLVVVVGRLLYVPLWLWLKWYLPLSTVSKFEKLDVLVGVTEIGFG